MHFNPEITLGNVLTIAAFVTAVLGAFYGLKTKMEVFTVLIQQYSDRFAQMEVRHDQRLRKLEDNNEKITSLVQHLMGQNDERVRWDGNERRERSRRT